MGYAIAGAARADSSYSRDDSGGRPDPVSSCLWELSPLWRGAGVCGWPAQGDASVPPPHRTAPAPTQWAGALQKNLLLGGATWGGRKVSQTFLPQGSRPAQPRPRPYGRQWGPRKPATGWNVISVTVPTIKRASAINASSDSRRTRQARVCT